MSCARDAELERWADAIIIGPGRHADVIVDDSPARCWFCGQPYTLATWRAIRRAGLLAAVCSGCRMLGDEPGVMRAWRSAAR